MRLTAILSILFASVVSLHAEPNIIIVMPDDMGYGDIGATGNPVIRTPHLDALSKAGADLTNFYVSPVCSPTRACLMTGRYNFRTRCIDTFKGRSMMDSEEVTLAEALKKADYTTGIFGKWHLGDNFPLRPQDQGFDEVLIHKGGGLAQPSEPIENERRYTDPILFRNGEKIQAKGYCTDVYFDAAIDFMKSAKESGRPFFAYIPPNAPHGPYHDVPEELLEYYQSIDLTPALNGNTTEKHKDTVARVFAMVENIDQNMGKLDRYLKESGQYENTLVFFFTDNGPNTMRYVGPFRGMKSHVHEGGIRTMCYARWPEQIKAGTKANQIAAHIDILPTVLDIAGAPEAATNQLDGKSLFPLLKGEGANWADRRLFIQAHRGNQPVEFHHFAVREQDWKLMRGSGFGLETGNETTPFELYHISEDPGETKNVAADNPEKVEALKAAYSEWLADVSATRENNYDPPEIIIGDEAELHSELSIQDWRVPTGSKGWGVGGKWYVNFASDGEEKVVVTWNEQIGARKVTLSIGDQKFESELKDGASELIYPSVAVTKGPSTVSVSVSDDEKGKAIPRFVTFE
ncbi:MAG: arylsulfatase [Verrucomicrobiales bacterium]|nr:arylsulfatase [Verrucomicrobiales bacterium]